jgi:UDP-2,3-diacylglucosamine hydrolase
VRDPRWQAGFLALPLEERRQQATMARQMSRESTRNKRPEITDVNTAAVDDALRRHDLHQMIHGHTHRPAFHDFDLDGRSARRIVLGDWYERGSVLRCSDDGRVQLCQLD